MSKIKNIAVVDDRKANRVAAAKAIAKVLPSARVRLYSSAAEFIAALEETNVSEIDLVLSDMKMEDEKAGYLVAVAAWSWNIPTFIVSGGQKDHGRDTVVVGSFLPQKGSFFGEKDDHLVWSKILGAVMKNSWFRTAVSMGKFEARNAKYGEANAKLSIEYLPH